MNASGNTVMAFVRSMGGGAQRLTSATTIDSFRAWSSMRVVRAIFLAVLLLATGVGQLFAESQILCIEFDGCISIEDVSSGCCVVRGSSSRSAEPGVEHDSCESCTDILIQSAATPIVRTTSAAPAIAPPLAAPAALLVTSPLPPSDGTASSFGRSTSPRELSAVRRC